MVALVEHLYILWLKIAELFPEMKLLRTESIDGRMSTIQHAHILWKLRTLNICNIIQLPSRLLIRFPKNWHPLPLSTQERLWGKWPRAKNGASNKLSLVSWSVIIRFTKVKAGKLETVSRISVGVTLFGLPEPWLPPKPGAKRRLDFSGQTVLYAVHRCCLGPAASSAPCSVDSGADVRLSQKCAGRRIYFGRCTRNQKQSSSLIWLASSLWRINM